MTPKELSSEQTASGTTPDPWEFEGFRVVPCMNADSVWVEIETPEHQGEPLPVEMAPDKVRAFAEFLTRVAATAEMWRGDA